MTEVIKNGDSIRLTNHWRMSGIEFKKGGRYDTWPCVGDIGVVESAEPGTCLWVRFAGHHGTWPISRYECQKVEVEEAR
jgi:hypothetical protein